MKPLFKLIFLTITTILAFASCDNTVGDLINEYSRENILCINTNLLTGGNGRGWKNAFLTLDQALIAAKDGDEIWVCGNLTVAATTITKDVKIIGGFDDDDQLKSDRQSSRRSDITLSGALTIDNRKAVSIENFNVYDSAPGATSIEGTQDSDITINNCRFYNNSNSGDGGAINLDQAMAKIIDCVFVNCIATALNGGGIYIENSEVNIENCIFENCQATSDFGGAISTNSSVVRIIKNKFLNCYSARYGGSLYAFSNSNVYVYESNFENSRADVYGGALAAITNSIVTVNRCNFIDNYSSSGGGAIVIVRANLYLYSSKFVGNNSGSGTLGGGAVCFSSGTIANEADISNCYFYNNYTSAGINGGAINMDSGNGVVNILNSTFYLNNSNSNGGAINNDTTISVNIYNSIFYNNTDSSGKNTIDGNTANISFYNSYSDAALTGATLSRTTVSLLNPFLSTDPSSSYFLQLNFSTVCYNGGYYGNIEGYTWPSTDLAGNPRIVARIDMGCYERQ